MTYILQDASKATTALIAYMDVEEGGIKGAAGLISKQIICNITY